MVTGGSRGIGFEIARCLLAQKARVVICGRKQDGLDRAAEKLAAGKNLLPHAAIVKTIPLGRIAEPIDIAHPTLFLCSTGSDFMTGQTLNVDGGASAI